MTAAQITPAQSSTDYADAGRLLREYAVALGVDLGFQGFAEELSELARMYGPPRGCLLLATAANERVGCVGVRAKDDEDCELKRLYVRPSARAGGLGRALSLAAIEQACQLGYRRMLLDTLPQMQVARALYRELGFAPTSAYYDNPIAGASYLALTLTNT